MIDHDELQDGEYYYGRDQFSLTINRTARWDAAGSCFVAWSRGVQGQRYLADVTYYEFEPEEIVTWGTDEIPLED